ncbi:MAG: helix-turn-helix transcriptional regulator [Acidobacteriaceae bacterium]|nr:helix-turn-helix transcriptional regulator [Acidobacteriaceae bacterium]
MPLTLQCARNAPHERCQNPSPVPGQTTGSSLHRAAGRIRGYNEGGYFPISVPEREPLTATQVRLIAKALADPRRNEILKQIGSRKDGIACAEIRECQSITAATLSHHLRELETAGLIAVVRKGKFADLSIRRDVLNSYLAYLKTF